MARMLPTKNSKIRRICQPALRNMITQQGRPAETLASPIPGRTFSAGGATNGIVIFGECARNYSRYREIFDVTTK